MDTSDTSTTLLLIAGGVTGGLAAGGAFSGGGAKLPAVKAQPLTKTAERTDSGSEAARKNRARRRAAISPGGVPPQLGVPGLLGVNPNDLGIIGRQ